MLSILCGSMNMWHIALVAMVGLHYSTYGEMSLCYACPTLHMVFFAMSTYRILVYTF